MSETVYNDTMTSVDKAWEIFMASKTNVRVIVEVSSAVRVAIGEAFGLVKGEDALGKLTTALRVLGVDLVVDGAIADDVVTYELAKEVKTRLAEGGKLPVVYSKKRKWTEAALANEALAPYVVNPRPAMQALAVALKKLYLGDEKRTYVIAIAPCSGKTKGGLREGDLPVTDLTLSTVETIDILRSADLDLKYVPASPWDEPFGVPSGCGYIADIGGGVAEGVLRSLASDRSEAGIRRIEYSGVRGYKAVRVGYSDVNAIVVAGDENTDQIAKSVTDGSSGAVFVEVVGKPLGCVDGCGQPEADDNTKRMRAYALYCLDKRSEVRVAEDSEDTVALSEIFATNSADDGFEEKDVSLSPFDVEPAAEEALEETVEEAVEEVVEEPAPAEEIAEEPVTEEPAVEETVEEAVEEAVEEPASAEEIAEEPVVEEPAAEETVEEAVEEAVEEPAPAEEIAEEPVAEEPAAEEIVEEPVEETVEEPVEETVEEPASAEEIAEEPVAEEPAAEETVEEAVEEADEPEDGKGPKTYDPNYRRMSKKERRKLKRTKNGK